LLAVVLADEKPAFPESECLAARTVVQKTNTGTTRKLEIAELASFEMNGAVFCDMQMLKVIAKDHGAISLKI